VTSTVKMAGERRVGVLELGSLGQAVLRVAG
jgi:hypothetical protein